MNVHPDSAAAEHITIESGKPAEMPHMLATNRYGTYCIPDDFKKREVPRLLRSGKVYEEDTLDFLRRHVGTGDIVTGGAFVGDFFPALHEVLSKKAQLHSFEPFPDSFDASACTMALNGLKQVILHRCAVGREPGAVPFAVARRKGAFSLGAGMHITDETDSALHTITVPVIPIDDLVPTTRRVTVLHLDVEGFEADALQGAARILVKSKPIVVLEGNKRFHLRKYLRTLNEVAPKAGYVHAGQIDHNSVYRPGLG